MTSDLTFVERTTLLVLMAESRPVKLVEFKTLGSELKKSERENLTGLGLIEVKKVGRGMVVELTDPGWAQAQEEFGAMHDGSRGGGGKVLYTLMKAIRRYFDRVGIEPNEVFLPPTTDATATDAEAKTTTDSNPPIESLRTTPSELEREVVSTYHRLASEPNAWVSLTRLRTALSLIDRADIDGVLESLYRSQQINLIPEANQRELTTEDRNAALHVGGQARHMMKIDR